MSSLRSLIPSRPLLVTLALVAALASGSTGALVVPGPVAAGEPFLEGIDVSRWQGAPAWVNVKAAGIRFVIAKATQGTTVVDPQWARNRARLRANRIPFTAYHYADPGVTPGDAVAEADHFLNTAKLDRYNLLPVLDLERHNELSPEILREWASAWLARVEQRLGVKAMIYTNSAFWIARMADTTSFAEQGHRLWIRHLNVESPTLPARNWGGHGWTLWQYAVFGGLQGINGKVDRDRYNGTILAPLRIKNNR